MKMRFYSTDMDLRVYDPIKRNITIKFEKGVYETEDPEEQELLSKVTAAHKNQDLTEEVKHLEVAEIEDERMIPVKKSAKNLVIKKEVKLESLNKNELMSRLDEEGIEYDETETKKDMIKKLQK